MLAMVLITALFGLALLLFVLSVRTQHRTIVCPIHGTVVRVRFLESLLRGRPVEVTECSAFTPPDFVTCSQRCLAQLGHPPVGKAALVIALLLLFATPAWAQVEIKTPAPAPPREERPMIVPPGLQQETRPSDADHYPRGGQVQYDPAFVGPMSKPYETPTPTGHYGLAGWVSPHTPVGSPHSGWGENYGIFAFGFSVTWDGPPVRRPVPPPKP